MNRRSSTRFLLLVTVGLTCSGLAQTPPAPGPELLDLARFGYNYRAERAKTANPPETQWLTEGKDDTLAGVMWEEHRPVRRVEIVFDGAAPDPASLAVEVTTNTPDAKQENRPTWWTRRWESFPGAGTRGKDVHGLSYETAPEVIADRLRRYPASFQFEPDPRGMILIDKLRVRFLGTGARPRVAALKVFGAAVLTPMEVEIEWGFDAQRPSRAFQAVLSAYNGEIAGPAGWRALAGKPHPVRVRLRYVADDTQPVRFRPGIDLPTGSTGALEYHPDRTVITVKTGAAGFSFAPRDLEAGPILIPSLGFYIRKAGGGPDAAEFVRHLAAERRKTVRERVRELPEQNFARVLDDHYGSHRPMYPKPDEAAPMAIDVPDALVEKAWNLAFWHVKRRCYLDKDGRTPLMYIWPYEALLGQESWRIAAALDLLGEHAVPGAGFQPWFDVQGKWLAAGMFFDKDGALNVPGWDLNHGQGHGSMLYAMSLHYLLTRDRAWLGEHRQNLEAACEWTIRQRQRWTALAGPDTWSAGLMPPSELGDYAEWRSLYQTNVFFWRGLKTAAEALADVAPEAAARYRAEAEALRKAIVRAARQSVELTPVIRVADGTYRQFIPPQPYLRGPVSEIANPFGGGHAGTLVMDTELGAATLALLGVRDDELSLDGLLDVLEDRMYDENWVVRMHRSQRMPGREDAWFSAGGYYYQCGYSQSALAHLVRDDVPNYLRSMFNQYAADIDPGKNYQFREHPNRTGEGNGGDKTFEAGAFLERLRAMFVHEDGDRLWLARGTPREWLADGRHIAVSRAPSVEGPIAYQIVSEARAGRIQAEVTLPEKVRSRVLLRLRHPERSPMRAVSIDGKAWTAFDAGSEAIDLTGLHGRVKIIAQY